MSLQDKVKQFQSAFADATENVFHFPKTDMAAPYIVWQESGANTLFANNSTVEQAVTGTLGYYTKTAFDPVVDTIQNKLITIGCVWKLISIVYEAETGLIHYEWKWEL